MIGHLPAMIYIIDIINITFAHIIKLVFIINGMSIQHSGGITVKLFAKWYILII